MDVFLSIDNRSDVIQLPVPPPEIEANGSTKNQTFETINGDILVPNNPGLAVIPLEGFFPANNTLPYVRGNPLKPVEYVEKIERWRVAKKPIRIVCGDLINKAVLIDRFDYGMKDGTGDIWYRLSFTEFRFAQV